MFIFFFAFLFVFSFLEVSKTFQTCFSAEKILCCPTVATIKNHAPMNNLNNKEEKTRTQIEKDEEEKWKKKEKEKQRMKKIIEWGSVGFVVTALGLSMWRRTVHINSNFLDIVRRSKISTI